ncbi:MAG: hypothetical protein MI923_24660 [Phycisphaerales bacterium]|nr:hypothetical protein [Phycisphaerales bacterium]
MQSPIGGWLALHNLAAKRGDGLTPEFQTLMLRICNERQQVDTWSDDIIDLAKHPRHQGGTPAAARDRQKKDSA